MFEKTWREMTILIRDNAGSLGSRLHKQNDTDYIAYAQWPDKATWKNSTEKLSELSKDLKKAMGECCEKTEVLFEMDVVDDLLEKNY